MSDGRRPAPVYHGHDVVDGGEARIILAALVTPADVTNNVPIQDLFRWVQFRWRLRPKWAIGDATYGTLDTIWALDEADTRAGFFGSEEFQYDGARDLYTCPRGTELCFLGNHDAAQTRAYQGAGHGLRDLPAEGPRH